MAVAIYDQGPLTVEVVDPFQKTFPKIEINSIRARGSQIAPKVIAERRAKKFLVSLFVGGKGTALNPLHIGKLLVRSSRCYRCRRLSMARNGGRANCVPSMPKKLMSWHLSVTAEVEVSINSNLVNPKELTSYWVLLNAKWKENRRPRSARGGKTGPCCIFPTAALGPPNLHKTLGLHG